MDGQTGWHRGYQKDRMSVRYAIRSIVLLRTGHTERQRGYQKDGMWDIWVMDGCHIGY